MLEVRQDTPESDDDGPQAPAPGAAKRSTIDLFFLVSVAAAILPILIATARAARRGWVPIGDNAYFAVRSADVFTEHHPLLGTWTSASVNTDTNFNNPGPLLFDLLALPVRIFGTGMGLGIGAAILNSLAVLGIAIVVRRRGGPVLGTAAMVVTALLCWTMGSELLYDPWQPHSLLLTFLFVLVLVWSLVCGDLMALPWAVFLGSVVIQTHLSYAILLVGLGAWGVVGLVLFLRRARAEDPEAWPAVRRRAVRAVVIAAAVGLLCWSQPVGEQISNGGEGNMSRLAGNATASDEKVGVKLGTRIVADVVTVPPFWLRPSFEDALRPDLAAPSGTEQLTTVDPSFPVAAAMLAALAAVLAALVWDARRRGDRVTSAALSTGAVACATGLLTAWNLPTGLLGLPAHQFRWLWPIAAFTSLALLVAVVRRLKPVAANPRAAVLAMAGVAVLVAALNIPTHNPRTGPSGDDFAIPVVRKLNRQMGALEGEGTLVVDLSGIRFAEPYSGPVIAELQRRDIPFAFTDEVLIRQFGPSRRLDGKAQRLIIREGSNALSTPDGMRRMALVEGLTEAEQDEFARVTKEAIDYLDEPGPVDLNERGEVAMERPLNKQLRSLVQADEPTGKSLVNSRGLQILVEQDLLDLDENVQPLFERYAYLQKRWDWGTVGLFLAPLEEGPQS